GSLRRVVVVGRRPDERGDLRRWRGRWRRRGARWWRRRRWRLLLRAEERVEGLLERLGHDDPVLRREDHALELRTAARRRRLHEDRLDVDEAASDWKHQQIPADAVRGVRAAQHDVLTKLRMRLATVLDGEWADKGAAASEGA